MSWRLLHLNSTTDSRCTPDDLPSTPHHPSANKWRTTVQSTTPFSHLVANGQSFAASVLPNAFCYFNLPRFGRQVDSRPPLDHRRGIFELPPVAVGMNPEKLELSIDSVPHHQSSLQAARSSAVPADRASCCPHADQAQAATAVNPFVVGVYRHWHCVSHHCL